MRCGSAGGGLSCCSNLRERRRLLNYQGKFARSIGVVGRAGCHRALSREKCMGPWVICLRLGWQMATVMDSAVGLVAFHGADQSDPWSLREPCMLIGPEIKAVQTGCVTFATKQDR